MSQGLSVYFCLKNTENQQTDRHCLVQRMIYSAETEIEITKDYIEFSLTAEDC